MTMTSDRSMSRRRGGKRVVARPQDVHRAEQRDLGAVAARHAPRGGIRRRESSRAAATPSDANRERASGSITCGCRDPCDLGLDTAVVVELDPPHARRPVVEREELVARQELRARRRRAQEPHAVARLVAAW